MTADPTAALPLFAQLQRESPPSARVCERLAECHGHLGAWGEVARLSFLSLEIDPKYYHAYYVLGVAAKHSGDLPKVAPHTPKAHSALCGAGPFPALCGG